MHVPEDTKKGCEFEMTYPVTSTKRNESPPWPCTYAVLLLVHSLACLLFLLLLLRIPPSNLYGLMSGLEGPQEANKIRIHSWDGMLLGLIIPSADINMWQMGSQQKMAEDCYRRRQDFVFIGQRRKNFMAGDDERDDGRRREGLYDVKSGYTTATTVRLSRG